MTSPWNKTADEWECRACGCWSVVGEQCWHCAEQEDSHNAQEDINGIGYGRNNAHDYQGY